MSAILNFFRGALEELHKVTWMTRNEAIRISIITLIFTFATAAFLGVFDQLFAQGAAALLQFAK